jgi:hypothetical protein
MDVFSTAGFAGQDLPLGRYAANRILGVKTDDPHFSLRVCGSLNNAGPVSQ